MHLGQRRDHDRDVDHDHQVAEEDDREDRPCATAFGHTSLGITRNVAARASGAMIDGTIDGYRRPYLASYAASTGSGSSSVSTSRTFLSTPPARMRPS